MKFKSLVFTLLLIMSNTAFSEPITLDCGKVEKYAAFRLVVDLESKTIKRAWLIDGEPSEWWSKYIIYDVKDDFIKAHSDDAFFIEAGTYTDYMVINRYSLSWFGAKGENWNHPDKDGNVTGMKLDCKKLERAL